MKKMKLKSETVRQMIGVELKAVVGGISGARCDSFVYSCIPECTATFPSTSGQPSMPAVCPM